MNLDTRNESRVPSVNDPFAKTGEYEESTSEFSVAGEGRRRKRWMLCTQGFSCIIFLDRSDRSTGMPVT